MIRAGVVRFWWRTVFALCERHRFDGADVRIFLPGTAERQILVQKCRGAFELLRTYAPRQLLRLRNFTDGVLVLGEDSFVLGEWMAPARLIRLNAAFILKPAILVPLPSATDDHQTANAREMARAGGARMIAQSDFTADVLSQQVAAIAGEPEALANAAARALSVGRPHATRDLADLVERIAGGVAPIEVGPAVAKRAPGSFAMGAPA